MTAARVALFSLNTGGVVEHGDDESKARPVVQQLALPLLLLLLLLPPLFPAVAFLPPRKTWGAFELLLELLVLPFSAAATTDAGDNSSQKPPSS